MGGGGGIDGLGWRGGQGEEIFARGEMEVLGYAHRVGSQGERWVQKNLQGNPLRPPPPPQRKNSNKQNNIKKPNKPTATNPLTMKELGGGGELQGGRE